MDKIKKNMKRIWNSKCKYLVIIACALILANGVNLLQTSLKFLNKKGEMVEEVKSVVIKSETWESKGPGSWKVEKSAEWTGVRKATIRFDVETTGHTGHSERDIILVLDNSGSMGSKVNGRQKLGQLQSDATELINFLLTEEGTRVAVISFNSDASLLSSFTSDSSTLISTINSLRPTGGTNYKKAYQKVIDLLAGYAQDSNRDLVMLFLTDGGAAKASAEYQILKDHYPIQIYGIQYELGSSIKQSIIESSDVQYAANVINLKDIFFESIGVDSYKEFEITDYITKEFEVENVSDIRVSRGKVKLEKDENGKQKVIWTLATSDVKFITSFSATMEIDVIYKGELNPDRVIETNEKEKITVDLPEPGPGPDEKESEETPGIRGGYYVIYDPNFPNSCNPSGENRTVKVSKFAYETVDKFYGNYNCSGWQLKGWEIEPGIPSLGDNQFEMPNHNITVKAIWTKLDISKGMDGEIAVPTQELLMAMKENAGTVSVDTGINFGEISSASNGRGLYIRSGTQNDAKPIYYYRGNVKNNNVLFAGMCWKIVRTTESGGIKLIYNGVSSDGKTCENVTNQIVGANNYYSNALSPAYVGYMRGTTGKYEIKNYGSYYMGTGATYNSSTGLYTLTSAYGSNLSGDSIKYNYHYACAGSNSTCSSLLYIVYAGGFTTFEGSFVLTNGETPASALNQMFSNTTNSNVKTTLDNWYKTNIDSKGYTNYLDGNTVWCNDRKIDEGELYLNNPTYTSYPIYGGKRNLKYGVNYFASYTTRHLNDEYSTPNPAAKESLACVNANDRFTTKNATVGNKALTYPVGMLTADEVILAGMKMETANTDSYLSTNYNYWTMTPYHSYQYGVNFGSVPVEEHKDGAYNFYMKSDGSLSRDIVSTSYNIRPAISLKPGIMVSAEKGVDGTAKHPYVVVKQ